MTKTGKVKRPGRGVGRVAGLVLSVAALGGAYLSWGSVYAAVAVTDIGRHSPVVVVHGVAVNVAAAVTALLLDMVILGASLKYVAGVKAGRPAGAWRGLAHTGIALTFLANAASASTWADVGWHLIAPFVWSAVVEFTARDILGDMREVRAVRPEVIPFRLWVTAPVESARTTFRMLRTGETVAAVVRLDADRRRAAADALRLELEGVETDRVKRWRVRRLAGRRLWAGTITPEDVFAAIGWDGEGVVGDWPRDADTILRSVLAAVRSSDRAESTPEIDRIESIESPDPARSDPPDGPIDRATQDAFKPIGDRIVEEMEAIARARSDAGTPIAREKDLVRVRAGVRSGELKWPLVIEQVREELHISPTYAKAAVRQINIEGDPRSLIPPQLRTPDGLFRTVLWTSGGDTQDVAQVPATGPKGDDEEAPEDEGTEGTTA